MMITERNVSGKVCTGLAILVMTVMPFTASPSVKAINNAINNEASNNSDNQPASPPAAAVKIDNFSFAPQALTIPVGTTVTWINRDDIPHTAVSTEGVFKSKVMDTDEKFSYTFTRAGTYSYYCTIHPKMTGKVVVR